MVKKFDRNKLRQKKHRSIRKKIVDDTTGNTLVSASTIEKGAKIEKGSNIEAAKQIGERIAKKALDKGITTVVFDRGGYVYTGRVKAVADAAREAGLKF